MTTPGHQVRRRRGLDPESVQRIFRKIIDPCVKAEEEQP
jgi:chorismate mutase